MSHTIMRYEEWEEETCDTCGHGRNMHYLKSERVQVTKNSWYIASGCMVLASLRGEEPKRYLEGENPYPRCFCTEFK